MPFAVEVAETATPVPALAAPKLRLMPPVTTAVWSVELRSSVTAFPVGATVPKMMSRPKVNWPAMPICAAELPPGFAAMATVIGVSLMPNAPATFDCTSVPA